jgi:hypothetical protein
VNLKVRHDRRANPHKDMELQQLNGLVRVEADIVPQNGV